MLQQAVINIIEQTAPLSLMAEWDHSGVQVASPRKEIRRLSVCLDPAPEQIRTALETGADMVLTHHPLAMRPQWTGALNGYTDTLRMLYSHDVPLYASHTTLDANPLGPAAWLPDELRLTGRSLLEKTGTFTAPSGTTLAGQVLDGGFGCVGDLPSPLSLKEVCAVLRRHLPVDRMCGVVRFVGNAGRTVRRVAVCTGSGSSLMEEAAAAGADLYITGDLKYHESLALRSRQDTHSTDACPMAILDVGHFSLEEEMIRRFALLLEKQLDGVTVAFLPGRDPFLPLTFLSEVPEVLS
ncbi:Nif3-like dinuclear metal center hexameric protein [uncultured Mailhella sp.]|uniref:Nif3-like dinuclear metal center hexameric protein n=1 Tax=uncultured Mailhella sp. TaxID=1981031 RepID=UPI002611DD0C|nr:Nif3-like dinuclear metal center hexameric protein [uncultured Mailhella sp.]